MYKVNIYYFLSLLDQESQVKGDKLLRNWNNDKQKECKERHWAKRPKLPSESFSIPKCFLLLYYDPSPLGQDECKFFSLLRACSYPFLNIDLSIEGFVASTTPMFFSLCIASCLSSQNQQIYYKRHMKVKWVSLSGFCH